MLDDEVDLTSVDLNLNESGFFVQGQPGGSQEMVDNRITELQPVQVTSQVTDEG